MGAYDQAHWETVVLELTPDKGVLQRGAVLSLGGAGKLDVAGRYWKAGEDVPDKLLSPFAEEVAASLRQDAATEAAREPSAALPLPADSEGPQAAPGTHVKRGSAFKPIERESALPGEQLYQRKGKAFVPVGESAP